MRKQQLTEVRGRLCVVTGAASGIGRAVALVLAGRGATLALTDRNVEQLQIVATLCREAGATVLVADPVDIAELDAVNEFATRVCEEGGPPEAIFHVAGISAWGRPDLLEHRHWRSMVEVNLMGTIHVVESFVPAMMAARRGHLVLVSSAAGLLGLPWHAAYSAAKFGVRGIAEVLRFDLAPYRVGVHLVCPGGVDTPLVNTVEIAGVDRNDPKVAKLVSRFRKHASTADEAADAIVTGVARGRYLIHTSADVRVAHALQQWCPPAYRAAMGYLNRTVSKTAQQVLP